MNQILYVERGKGKKEKRASAPLDISKILLIFAICFIVFGVAMIGKGAYAIAQNGSYTRQIEQAVPEATFEKDGQYVTVRVAHVKAIDTISYNWNGDENTTIKGQGSNTISEKIELPAGNNTLNLTIKDVSGKTNTYKKDYTIETGKDIKKPQVDISVVGNNVRLVATDDAELSYVTYRWNEETEELLQPAGAENAKIEKDIEIRVGQNKLTVIAVDSSNNTTTREEVFEGRMKPTVELYVDGSDFLIIAKHDLGINRLDITVNGQTSNVYYAPTTEVVYRHPMAEGLNKVSITAYCTDGTTGTAEGEATYTPPPAQ